MGPNAVLSRKKELKRLGESPTAIVLLSHQFSLSFDISLMGNVRDEAWTPRRLERNPRSKSAPSYYIDKKAPRF